MSLRENSMHLKPPPPPTLSKELLGIWSAWTRIGDREVVREAVVKGLHIELAHTFLAARKDLEDTKIKKWFKDEVFLWVSELLIRQQIFKASHILTNLNLDPMEEFVRIFTETFDKALMNFLGNYLIKCEKLESNFKEAWMFLQILIENDDVLAGTDDEFVDFNVRVLDSKSMEWKNDIGTSLFFKTFDTELKPFLTPNKVWKYLLTHQHADLIKLWIETSFTKQTSLSSNSTQELIELFLQFQITDDMINLLFDHITNFPIEIQQTILNDLCTFGIFSTYEKANLELLLRRVVKSERLNSLYDILNNKTSQINLHQFNELLLDYCVKNQLFSILNACNIDYSSHCDFVQKSECKFLNLISYLKSSCEISLGDNIFKVAEFLADDLHNYFISNPFIFLAVLMFSFGDVDLLKIFKANSGINLKGITITPYTTQKILSKLPFLNQIINQTSTNITYYDLLHNHCGLNTNIFNDDSLNFNSSSLVEKYAYKRRVNYIFYIRQGRPSFATKCYFLDKLKMGCDNKSVNRKVFKVATQNFLNKEITVSCVAFLEMIGHSSYSLRIYIKAANIFYESGLYSFEDIQDLLQNVCENPVCFLEKLERVLIGNFLSPDYSNFDLIDEIRKQEIVVQFSQIHKLKLPELFLECCAKNNFWFPFLLFIQKHNYPLHQVQRLIYNFKNSALAEHLYHGLSHDIQIDDQKDLLMRDTRKYYLSRIGVRQSIETSSMDGIHSSVSSFGSYGSTGSSSSSSDLFDNDTSEFKTDLLQILIKCHNSIDPPKALLQACNYYKNPIFAVLATSYEPDSIISNWFTWLSVSCGVENKFINVDSGVLSATLVTRLLNVAIQKCYNKILLESFLIFLPENPLRLFVDFLISCMSLNFDKEILTEKLKLFQKELLQRKSSNVIMDVDYEMMFLNNKTWIESSAIELCCTSLHYNYKSQYNQLQFLKFLHEIEITNVFTTKTLDFLKCYDVINSLFEHKCDIKLNLSVIYDKDLINQDLLCVVNKLVSHKDYKCAFEIAKISGFAIDSIVINEWHNKFKNRSDCNEFWALCDSTFKDVDIQPNIAVDFYEKCADEIEDKIEKYNVLNLAHKWATFSILPNLYNVEKKLWLAYFEIENKISNHDFAKMSPQKILYSEMKQKLESIEDSNYNAVEFVEDNSAHLNRAIQRLLNIGDFWQALRLAKIFKYSNRDLEVITLSFSLAEGLLMPYQLDAAQRLLLNKRGHTRTFSRHRKLISSKVFSSFCSGASSPSAVTVIHMMDHVDVPLHDTLAALEALLECSKVGIDIVQNVLLNYRIALNIEKSYQDVFMCNDPVFMLKEALKNDCVNKLEVVNDCIALFKWTNEQIADFLCGELTSAIAYHIKLKLEPVVLWNINLDADFHLIIQLLNENCSVLGLKLYKQSTILQKMQSQSMDDFKIPDIELAIALLIRAHDCFTADCNMEGISIILRKCQSMISLLLILKSWKLIVRLLTGVARYTEMNYVFHILRENDQFEFLLCKGSRKDNGLKVALLKYLKKYCPENRELYRMVALHFTLFSEIAQLWEEEARSIVRNLIAISKLEMQNNGLHLETQPYVLLTNTDGTKICLNKAMVNYTHATEYHLQGEKLAKAMSSAKQAELLALQLSMLKGLANNGTTICVLNLSEGQISSLIAAHLRFAQATILIEAYNHKADWASVLFEQFVIRNEANYLDSFLESLPLTDTIVNDISRKFMVLKAFSDSTTKNMKEIVDKCTSVSTKYRIASELGFTDLIQELLAGNELAF